MTTLDILSNGRLRVGFGPGCSVGADRSIFAGSLDQVKKDIDDVKKLDANEIFFMIFSDGPIEDLVAVMERYRSLV
jgi:alkanesulfonate monooxygenase SsuD/methylene tetrahydromethanopterin reductase-like flavin-dependent oxidoreductase (luciferase family)